MTAQPFPAPSRAWAADGGEAPPGRSRSATAPLRAARPAARLGVRWFDAWEPVLDEALAELPDLPSCPRPVYRALATAPTARPKRVALVTRAGTPVALVALRRVSRSRWEPVTQWIVPAAVCAALPEDVAPALASLRHEIVVGWWRMGDPPRHPSVRDVQATTVHRIALDEAEQHWRQGKHWQNVNRARRRCAALAVATDEPGAAEWVTRNWEAHWHAGPADGQLSDRVLAARELERAGLLHTVTLSQDGRWLAGATCVADGPTLTASLMHREPVDRRLPTGVRLIDATFENARERGFTTMDLGGGQDYKHWWAPEAGHRYQFTVAPPVTYHSLRLYRRTRQLAHRARLGGRAGAAEPTSGAPS